MFSFVLACTLSFSFNQHLVYSKYNLNMKWIKIPSVVLIWQDLTTRRVANLPCHWISCQQAKSQNILIITRGSVHASVWLEHWRWSVLEKLDGANYKGSLLLKNPKLKLSLLFFCQGPNLRDWIRFDHVMARKEYDIYTNLYEWIRI